MIRLANVLIVDGKSARAQRMIERLSRGGYHAILAAGTSDAMRVARVEHPDLVLIGEPDGAEPVAFGAMLRQDAATADIPVLVYADRVTGDICSRALDAGLDDVLTIDCDDGELFARMRPLVRLATMHSELRQRASAAKGFGVAARDRVAGPGDSRPTILIIGDAPEAVRTVLDGDADISATDSLYDAEEMLTRRNFDAAVLSFAGEPEGLLGFCSQVRNNPRLFNLPMVLLAGENVAPLEAYSRGATRVLFRPVEPVSLRAAVLTLVRRQRLRWAIRSALNESLHETTRDPVTGTYGRAFLETYLASRLAAAKAQKRHLTVVFFAAPNIDGVRRQFGEDAALHLTQQLGQWIVGLLRAEDLTAAFKANEFCVVLPDTPQAEAEVVMHRIAGVLAYTDFAVREVYQPVKVWVQVGCTEPRDDDDLVSLLDRARHLLD